MSTERYMNLKKGIDLEVMKLAFSSFLSTIYGRKNRQKKTKYKHISRLSNIIDFSLM